MKELKKIGFLSSDFRNHAVGHQMIGLLENLDPEKYEFFSSRPVRMRIVI